jgi:hypothetical protein
MTIACAIGVYIIHTFVLNILFAFINMMFIINIIITIITTLILIGQNSALAGTLMSLVHSNSAIPA